MLRLDAIQSVLDRVKDEPIIANLGGTTFHLHFPVEHVQLTDSADTHGPSQT